MTQPSPDTGGPEVAGVGERACDVPHASDERLLRGFIGGDEAMFAELVKRYEAPLYGFICRVTSPADAPDLFQETFLRVYQHAGSFRGQSGFKRWLYVIALNVCRSHGRKLKTERTRRSDSDPDLTEAATNQRPPAELAEIGDRVAGAVGELPWEQREVVILKTYEEMNYREIAELLGRPLGTVKSQMRLALGKLRGRLHDIAEAYELG